MTEFAEILDPLALRQEIERRQADARKPYADAILELEKRVQTLHAALRQQIRVNDVLLERLRALEYAYAAHVACYHGNLPQFRVDV